ncbi:MAG: FAD:protein FMN transferase [Candidatus Izemoplasmataceae bacterium]
MKKIWILITLLTIGILSACQASPTQQSRNFIAFGTIIRVDLYGNSNTEYREIFTEVQNLLDHIHKVSTKYDSYEGVNNVKYLNSNPNTVITVDPMLIEMIELSNAYHNDERTQGKFNIAIGEVLKVWSTYREACLSLVSPVCELPEMDELIQAASNIDPNNIVVDKENSTVMIPEGMSIDLGGIAKGYGAELVGELIKGKENIRAFQINAGGSNVEFYGEHPSNERNYWIGSLRNPYNPSAPYALVRVNSEENIVTSGDYERFYTVDGQDYHHLIDPDSFYPTFHIRAVTVISKNPTLGDIYSTVAFLLPLEDAIMFIDSLDDVEAIWVDDEEKAHFSENFIELYLHQLMIDTDYDTSAMHIPDPLTSNGANPLTTTLLIMLAFIVGSFTIVVIRDKKKQALEK